MWGLVAVFQRITLPHSGAVLLKDTSVMFGIQPAWTVITDMIQLEMPDNEQIWNKKHHQYGQDQI